MINRIFLTFFAVSTVILNAHTVYASSQIDSSNFDDLSTSSSGSHNNNIQPPQNNCQTRLTHPTYLNEEQIFYMLARSQYLRNPTPIEIEFVYNKKFESINQLTPAIDAIILARENSASIPIGLAILNIFYNIITKQSY